jgi:signal transduction histidine kinase
VRRIVAGTWGRWSLRTQVILVTIAALLLLLAVLWVLARSSLPKPFYRWGLEENAPAIAELVFLIEAVPAGTERYLLDAFSGPLQSARIDDAFPEEAETDAGLVAAMHAADAEGLLDDREIRFQSGLRWLLLGADPSLRPGLVPLVFEIDVALGDGRVLRMAFAPGAFLLGRPGATLAFGLLAVIIVTIAASSLIVRLMHPLARLERFAAALGERLDTPPVAEEGPRELRRLARTLNDLQLRVSELLADRWRTYSALAHDLRTGITRLQLRIESGRPEALAAAQNDLDQMSRLVDDMLLYGRSARPAERNELVDAVALARDWARTAEVPLEADASEAPCWIVADEIALRRVLDNLAENARRYASAASLGIERDESGLRLAILDDGPGIPEADLERVFEPFERLDHSRSRDTGGSGLGLGIARELMRAMGGDVTLCNRTAGGLEARVTVPAACIVD